MLTVTLISLAICCGADHIRTCRPPSGTARRQAARAAAPNSTTCNNMLQFLLILLLRHVRTNCVTACEEFGQRSNAAAAVAYMWIGYGIGGMAWLMRLVLWPYWRTSHSKSLRLSYDFITKANRVFKKIQSTNRPSIGHNKAHAMLNCQTNLSRRPTNLCIVEEIFHII